MAALQQQNFFQETTPPYNYAPGAPNVTATPLPVAQDVAMALGQQHPDQQADEKIHIGGIPPIFPSANNFTNT